MKRAKSNPGFTPPFLQKFSLQRGKAGFTLIEMLLAASIFAVISLAVYSTFSSGIKLWKRSRELGLKSKNRIIKLEKLKREIRSIFVFKKDELAFSGTKDKLILPAIIDSQISRLAYSFDPAKNTIFRNADKLENSPGAKDKAGPGQDTALPYLYPVKEFRLSYFYFDPRKSAYSWSDDWQEEFLPTALRLNLTFEDEKYTATIFIPSA